MPEPTYARAPSNDFTDAGERGARYSVQYPPDRAREGITAGAATLTDLFMRVESTQGYATLGDALVLLFAFSGHPNRIEISVENQDATIQLRNETNRTEHSVTVRAGQTWVADVNARYVFAQNATAGLTARAQVIGRY